MTRLEALRERNLGIPDKYLDEQKYWYNLYTKDDAQIEYIKSEGFEDVGSYHTIVRRDRYLYNKEGKQIFLTCNGEKTFNVEFSSFDIAAKTFLNLSAIDNLKFIMNNDKISIDFYLDKSSLTQIINNYTS